MVIVTVNLKLNLGHELNKGTILQSLKDVGKTRAREEIVLKLKATVTFSFVLQTRKLIHEVIPLNNRAKMAIYR